MLCTLGLYIINVQLSRTTTDFLTIFIFGMHYIAKSLSSSQHVLFTSHRLSVKYMVGCGVGVRLNDPFDPLLCSQLLVGLIV